MENYWQILNSYILLARYCSPKRIRSMPLVECSAEAYTHLPPDKKKTAMETRVRLYLCIANLAELKSVVLCFKALAMNIKTVRSKAGVWSLEHA
jgi:hypothetical protein